MSRFTVLACALALIVVSPTLGSPESRLSSAVSCTSAVSWQNARQAVGRTVAVKGPVAGTFYARSSNGSPTFLNLGRDYPSSRRFTVVIWGRNRLSFGAPERRYRGRTICVIGSVSTYQGIPEIEATRPSQIRVIG